MSYVGRTEIRAPVRVDPSRAPLHHAREGEPGRVVPADLFDVAFLEALTGLKVSGHARERLNGRGIGIDGAEAERIRSALERLDGKNARESVVIVDDRAYVLSVANRTLITAMDGKSIREHVFTGIDSAALG